MNNKLFCTFTSEADIQKTLVEVKSSYDILYKKIFVLYIKSNDEYVCTYNVEPSSVESILPNTILVHRKKGVKYSIYNKCPKRVDKTFKWGSCGRKI